MHWNKIEWVNPKIHDDIKNLFCMYSKRYVSKITINLHIGLVTRNKKSPLQASIIIPPRYQEDWKKNHIFVKRVACTSGYDTQKEIRWFFKKIRQKHLTSKDNQQEQNIGLILIMSGWNKILWHVNHIYIKKYIKLDLGVIQHTTILLFFFWAGHRDPIAWSLLGGGSPSQNSGYKITRLYPYLC